MVAASFLTRSLLVIKKDLFLAPFLANLAVVVDEALSRDTSIKPEDNDQVFLATFGLLASIGICFSGTLLALSGVFKLANLGSFLPFPVICGFFSAVGILTWTLAITVDTGGKTVGFIIKSGDPQLVFFTIVHHAPTVLVASIMKYLGPKNPFYVVMVVFATIGIFYGVMFVKGVSLEEAIKMGWYVRKSHQNQTCCLVLHTHHLSGQVLVSGRTCVHSKRLGSLTSRIASRSIWCAESTLQGNGTLASSSGWHVDGYCVGISLRHSVFRPRSSSQKEFAKFISNRQRSRGRGQGRIIASVAQISQASWYPYTSILRSGGYRGCHAAGTKDCGIIRTEKGGPCDTRKTLKYYAQGDPHSLWYEPVCRCTLRWFRLYALGCRILDHVFSKCTNHPSCCM